MAVEADATTKVPLRRTRNGSRLRRDVSSPEGDNFCIRLVDISANPPVVTYVDETRSLVTGNPLEDLLCTKFYPDDLEKDEDPASETSRKATPVRSNSASRENHKVRGPKPAHVSHSTGSRVMYPRTRSTDPDHPADEHLRAKGSASPFDTQPWRISPSSNPLSPRHTLGDNSLEEEVSAFPLKSRTEAVLFRHYIAKLAPCVR